MKKTIVQFLILLPLGLGILGCRGGGSGSVSTGGVFFSHSDLAREFVRRAWMDAGISMSLVKTFTHQYNYIVVSRFGEYRAYYIGSYNVGENISRYISNTRVYRDLERIGDNFYHASGIVFSQDSTPTKDMAALSALEDEVATQELAQHFSMNFQLSEDRSLEIARLTQFVRKTPKAALTDQDYDAFATELVGAPISNIQEAASSYLLGDTEALNGVIEVAAEKNKVGPEHMRAIMMSFLQ